MMNNKPSTMESAIESIVGRPLSNDERKMLINLRDQYGYDDNDPLVVVLAMTGAMKILAEDIPNRLKATAAEVTETHLVTLREQSMFVAKDIVGNVAGLIHSAKTKKGERLLYICIGVAIGIAISIAMTLLIKHFI